MPVPLSEAEEADRKAFLHKFKPDAAWRHGEGSYSIEDGQISLSFGHCLTPRTGSVWLLKGKRGVPENLLSFPVKYKSKTAVGEVDEILRAAISDLAAHDKSQSGALKQFMESLNLDQSRFAEMMDSVILEPSPPAWTEPESETTLLTQSPAPNSEKPWWACADPSFAPFTAEEARSMLLRVLAERRLDQICSARRT